METGPKAGSGPERDWAKAVSGLNGTANRACSAAKWGLQTGLRQGLNVDWAEGLVGKYNTDSDGGWVGS